MPLGNLEYLCVHHVLLAHAKAYRLYQEKYKATQNGRYIFNFGGLSEIIWLDKSYIYNHPILVLLFSESS